MSGPAANRGIAVLASGEGTNLQALIDAAARDALYGRIELVLSDRADAGALVRARAAGIPAVHLPPGDWPDRAAYDRALAALLAEHGIGLVVLAGFMRILDAEVVDGFAGRMLNIHPSLLPRHRGLHPHRKALAAGDRVHGATVHFVVPELDAGPSILQYRIAIQPWDNPASLSRRVREGEHFIYPLAVRWWLQGRLDCRDGQARLDGQPLAAPLVVTRDMAPVAVCA